MTAENGRRERAHFVCVVVHEDSEWREVYLLFRCGEEREPCLIRGEAGPGETCESAARAALGAQYGLPIASVDVVHADDAEAACGLRQTTFLCMATLAESEAPPASDDFEWLLLEEAKQELGPQDQRDVETLLGASAEDGIAARLRSQMRGYQPERADRWLQSLHSDYLQQYQQADSLVWRAGAFMFTISFLLFVPGMFPGTNAGGVVLLAIISLLIQREWLRLAGRQREVKKLAAAYVVAVEKEMGHAEGAATLVAGAERPVRKRYLYLTLFAWFLVLLASA